MAAGAGLKEWRGRSRASLLSAEEIFGQRSGGRFRERSSAGDSATISSRICEDANVLQRMAAYNLVECSARRRTLLKQSWTARHTIAEIVCIASQNHYRKGAWRVQSSFPTAFSTEPWKRLVDLAS